MKARLSPTNRKSSFPRSHDSAIVLKIEKSSLLLAAPGKRQPDTLLPVPTAYTPRCIFLPEFMFSLFFLLLRDCDASRLDQLSPSLRVGPHGLKHRRGRTAIDVETNRFHTVLEGLAVDRRLGLGGEP